ncbi:hypothetical protein SAMN02910456_02310 [Ruminococcaceae bacterium YRB3002]|nr:hypothetical protein SAMN02910456_02310 [Ruminococcaceae bacterium YRB3002]
MEIINGEWYLNGVDADDARCVHTAGELLEVIGRVGFLPLFANAVDGFSVENMTDPGCWWSGDAEHDPWEWRTALAETGEVAYGKFFGNKAGFISREWFPYMANYRRDGYDFDACYEDGRAGYREKLLMDLFLPAGVDLWDVKPGELATGKTGCAREMFTFEMKEKGGFGKGGEKNFEGTLAKLQMRTYLVASGFRPRLNKRGEEYGWSVAVMTPPEYLWGYEFVTGRYKEAPQESFAKIAAQVGKHFDADGRMVRKVI